MARKELIDLVPQQVDLRLYIGDDPIIQWVGWTDATKTAKLDLSPFTNWEMVIRAPDDTIVTATIDTSQAVDGIISGRIEGEDLRALPKNGKGCLWDLSVKEPPDIDVTVVRGRVSLVNDAGR